VRAKLSLGLVGALLLLASPAAGPVLASPPEEERIGVVEILPGGHVLFQGQRVRAEAIDELLRGSVSTPDRVRLELRPNPGVSYEDLIKVMRSAKDAGYHKLALVLSQETAHLVPTLPEGF